MAGNIHANFAPDGTCDRERKREGNTLCDPVEGMPVFGPVVAQEARAQQMANLKAIFVSSS
jgi:hypothetical protein